MLLRPGPLTPEQIRDQVGIELQISKPLNQASQPVSPGQIESHYAPRATVRLNAEDKRQDEVISALDHQELGSYQILIYPNRLTLLKQPQTCLLYSTRQMP